MEESALCSTGGGGAMEEARKWMELMREREREERDWGYGGSRRFRWKYKDEGERKKKKKVRSKNGKERARRYCVTSYVQKVPCE